MRLNPYLVFDGNCAEAFAFYAQVFGGKVGISMKFADAPDAKDVPPAALDRIMHTSLIAGDAVLMGSDGYPGHGQKMTGFSVSIAVPTAEEAERIYAALAEGGEVKMQMQETFWAIRFGVVADRFGTPWMINCERTG